MDHQSRHKSSRSEINPLVQAAKEEVLPGYEEYLVLLQERNRLLKKLRKKSKKQMIMEKKEQGFTLYVNGANASLKGQHPSPANNTGTTPWPKSRKLKTAGEARDVRVLDQQSLAKLAKEGKARLEQQRAKTAPSARERRRNWNMASVEIQTSRGDKQKIKAPEILTGNYEDDFEDSDEFHSSGSDDSMEKDTQVSKSYNSDEDDMEIDASKFTGKSSPKKYGAERKRQESRKHLDNEDDEDRISEKLFLTISDLKKLRQSLEMNSSIKQSMAKEVSSDEDDIQRPPSIMEEEEEEVEEDLVSSMDNLSVGEDSPKMKKLLMFQPGDTIVLEFGGPVQKKERVERKLSAARKTNEEEDILPKQYGIDESQSRKNKPRSKSATTVHMSSDMPAMKQARPLSANRKMQEKVEDPDYEASAVLAALKAENEQAAKYTSETNTKVVPVRSKQTPAISKSREGFPSKVKPKPTANSMRASSENSVRKSEQRDMVENSPRKSLSREVTARDSKDMPNDTSVSYLNNERMREVMNKILKMPSKHQCRLVKMLGKLEESVVEDVKSSDKLSPELKSVKEPVKATVPVSRMSTNNFKLKSTATHEDDPNIIVVHMKLLSNWGHHMRLGLTEIQFFNQKKQLISVKPADVTVHAAEDTKGTIDLLFNGKMKTNKERNMWSCRYRPRRPVELVINLRNTDPGDQLEVATVKIWNFNTSLKELDIGVKDVQIFIKGQMVFSGQIDKGCGNQVFDYGHIIDLTNKDEPKRETTSEEPSTLTTSKHVVDHSEPKEMKTKAEEVLSGPIKSHIQTEIIISPKSHIGRSENNGTHIQSSPQAVMHRRSPSPKAINNNKTDLTHRNTSPSPVRTETRNSMSRLSQSSASSGGESQPNSRPTSAHSAAFEKPPVRSETRILHHPPDTNIRIPSVGSESDEDENHKEDVKTSGKPKSSRTPRKSKRMAARLDGLSSTDIESSRSVTESSDNRPPLPVLKKVDEKPLTQKNREGQQKYEDKSDVGHSQEKSSNISSEAKTKRSEKKPSTSTSATKVKEPAVSEQIQLQQVSLSDSITQSQDDIPMLQKLKDMNKKDQSSSRKKEIPKWLKHDSIAPFENPAESKDSQLVDTKGKSTVETTAAPLKKEEVDMLIDEELSMWPQRGKDHLSTVLDQEQGTDSKKLATVSEEGIPEGVDTVTPMQRIQKNRAKWRETQNLNLEESWGSLSRFKQSQKGRLSLDMDDDYILSDEYLNPPPPKKQEPTIAEEDAELENLLAEAEEEEMDDGFVIPELPSGKELVINILTTWGDRHYVGLTGIDIFSSTGEPVSIAKILAEPKDINILSEYEKDPRVISNIIDGVNRTRDDIHMWLTPFTPGSNHFVYITFDKPCKIALMRIWNYNKSRIHSYRGAKDVVITLDNVVIFKGEIARACGGVEGGTEAFGDTILFTTDEAILDSVSKNDESYEGEMLSDDEPFDVPFERPSTAEGDDRPFTRAVGNVKTPIKEVPMDASREETFLMACEGDVIVYKGKCVELNFTSTWGDPHYLGLTGLEIVGKDGEALPVTMSMLTANPRDVRSLPGHEKDDRTLEKLIDGTNVTISDEHMWLIPFTEGQNHTLTIDFGQKVLMAGLRFWNYNKSREDTYRGAKIVHVKVDGKVISPPSGYLIRKGPGVCHFDFAQEISFAPSSNNSDVPNPFSGQVGTNDEIDDAYEYVQMPSGFIYQFQLFSTWGDPYYVGLNGIEFYDASFKKIQLTQSNISAYPDSVNVLDNVTNDVRTPDKLIDGCNDSTEGNHSWLAPILPTILNRVYVIFDQLTTVSMVKIWNYSKTPQRGAKDFALLVDDLLVYNGELKVVPHVARGIVPTAQASQPYHTIIFTNKKEILKREKNTIISNQGLEQDIQMTNDMKIVSHYADPKKAQSGKPVDQETQNQCNFSNEDDEEKKIPLAEKSKEQQTTDDKQIQR